MPSNARLSRLLAARWLVDTCAITAPGEIDVTESGGTEVGDATTTSDVPCRLTKGGTRGAIEVFGEQLAVGADWMLSVARDTAIAPGWTVTAGGVVYAVGEVAGDAQTGSAYAHALLRKRTPIAVPPQT